MKPRELRRKVLIKARIRVAERWGDALILNMSSRGLLIQARQPPRRGTYIEVRRGRHVIIARAVWVGEDRFGAHTQDVVPVDAVVHDPDSPAAARPLGSGWADRRSAPRAPRTAAEKHEDNRMAARLAEFACFIFVGAAAASMAFLAVEDALANPIMAVTAALD